MKTLDSLNAGAVTMVNRVRGDRVTKKRLADAGLVPGCDVTVLGVSPHDGKLHLAVRNNELAISLQDAAFIETDDQYARKQGDPAFMGCLNGRGADLWSRIADADKKTDNG